MMKKKLLTGALSAAMLVTLCVPRTLLTKAETTSPVLVCDKEEHTHSAECYEISDEPTCGQEESEGHKHDDSCYEITEELTCTRNDDHTHDESCYTIKRELTCGEKESAGHTHSDSCYKKELICGLEEHKHNKDCYETVEETEEETTAPETEASTDAEETGAPETEESTEAAETETTAAEETTGAETPETAETKETEARECTCGIEDGIHDEDCPLYKETSKATASNATTTTTPPAPVTQVHLEGCTDDCTGENCACPCHKMSLFDRLMTCETLDEIWKILDATTDEAMNDLPEEELDQIDAKIRDLEQLYPTIVIDDMVEDTVQSEIVRVSVDVTDVAPFLAPVKGGR